MSLENIVGVTILKREYIFHIPSNVFYIPVLIGILISLFFAILFLFCKKGTFIYLINIILVMVISILISYNQTMDNTKLKGTAYTFKVYNERTLKKVKENIGIPAYDKKNDCYTIYVEEGNDIDE